MSESGARYDRFGLTWAEPIAFPEAAMRTRMALTACAAMLMAVATGAAEVAPPPRAVDDLWLAKPEPRETRFGEEQRVEVAPPRLFPHLAIPESNKRGPFAYEERLKAIDQRCPRLTRNPDLVDEPGDTVPQRLLKARLNQAVAEFRAWEKVWRGPIAGILPPYRLTLDCLNEVRAVAPELWADRPAELIPWLEEVVVQTADWEHYTRRRVEAGTTWRWQLNYMTRQRLRAEATLWEATHPEPRRKSPQPAPKDAGKGVPPAADPLDDKKPPLTLFPDLVPPPPPDEGDPKGADKFTEQFAKQCPQLSGNPGLTIEASDAPLRRVLKARLYQSAIELQRRREGHDIWTDRSSRYDCVDDALATVTELFSGQSKELAAWLEELVVEAKRFERVVWKQAATRAGFPADTHAASRSRLKVEAELWKVKNPK